MASAELHDRPFGRGNRSCHEHHETYGYHPDYSAISLSSENSWLRIFHLLVKRFSKVEKL